MRITWSCSRLLPRCCTSRMISKVGVLIFLLSVTGTCVFWRADITSFFLPRDERPCACDRCLAEDGKFYMQREKFAEPFYSINHNLSEYNFDWWKHLQSRKPTFSAFKEAVKGMFKMFPTNAPVEAPSPNRCRTCAVVGNSLNLKNSHYGPLIDFQDFVIRINRGRTKGFEADVGTRTTHHVMYPESAVNIDNTTHLVFFPFKIRDFEWIIKALNTGIPYEERRLKVNTDLMMVLNPVFMRYVHEVWLQKKGHYPSTGFLALILAMHICDEVHVFGFGADSDGNWSHYWEELRNKRIRTGGHPGDVEYAMIQELHQNQILTFYRGW